ncbi:MAG: glycosyltransferase, partial [Oscillospiraceae bacterium]|nr:glycosyltransferase [Oscillospiraceae bacterium]
GLPPRGVLRRGAPGLASFLRPVKQVLFGGHPLLAAARLMAKWQISRDFPLSSHSEDSVVFATLQKYWDKLLPLLPRQEKEYDAAISFQWPHHYVARRVKAKYKAAWVHTDFRAAALNTAGDLAVWREFNDIAAVSRGVLEGFADVHPALTDRCFVFENLLSPAAVRAKADAFVPEDMPCPGNAFRLLTVGRFCYPKAFDQALRICGELLALGLNLVWYAIGFGSEAQPLRRLIEEMGLEDRFILLGQRENPYPYMKVCDLYVQPSRYEGKAVTVMEALTLGKPVVVTNFPTAAAQVEDGADARIVPMDPPAAAREIAALLADPAEMRRLADNAAKRDYSGYDQLEGLYERLCV